jgi:hypothetical protein
MIFSRDHDAFIKETLRDLPADYLQIAEAIKGINSHEKVIWHLTCQWMKSLHGTNEDRKNAHLQQLRFVMVCLGPIVNLLTDDEWDEVSDSWNIHLSHLRTFNGSFLGRYYQNNEIGSRTADFYNIYAWIVCLYPWFASDIKKMLEKRSEKMSSSDLEIINQSLGELMLSLSEFQKTHQVTEEVMRFVAQGLNLSSQIKQGTSWESFFSTIQNKPTPPRYNID